MLSKATISRNESELSGSKAREMHFLKLAQGTVRMGMSHWSLCLPFPCYSPGKNLVSPEACEAFCEKQQLYYNKY